MKPLQPVPASARIAYGLAFFALFVALWSVATFGGYVQRLFLADPLTMVREGYNLLVQLRLRLRHRHDHLARRRRLRAGGRWWRCRSAS